MSMSSHLSRIIYIIGTSLVIGHLQVALGSLSSLAEQNAAALAYRIYATKRIFNPAIITI